MKGLLRVEPSQLKGKDKKLDITDAKNQVDTKQHQDYNSVKKRGGTKVKITSLDEALKRIEDLEKEVAELRAENEQLRSRNFGGRKKHDENWMASYNDFKVKYEGGMSIVEIVSCGEISRRTAYRYLAYYKQFQKYEKDFGSKSV